MFPIVRLLLRGPRVLDHGAVVVALDLGLLAALERAAGGAAAERNACDRGRQRHGDRPRDDEAANGPHR